MFDRFKKPRAEEPKPDAREPAPSAGGFGRRQTSVGGAPVGDLPPSSATAPGGFGRRPVSPKPTEQPAGEQASAATGAPGGEPKIDVSKEIVDWLLVELKDGRGVHCETMLTVLGALAGFAAQQAIWSAAIAAGVTPKQAFMVVGTASGESFYYSEAANQMLVATRPDAFSLWGFIAELAKRAGVTRLPDPHDVFKHTAGVVGSDRFGVPRLPPQHMPRFLPREALNRYWPKTRALLEIVKPELWPAAMTMAVARTMMAMKDACALDLACAIVMEAAVPMSKVDPATVPKVAARH